MPINFKYLAIILLLINIMGCTTYSEARKQLVDSLPESERAYLVGKYSVQCKPNSKGTKCNQSFNSISLHYRSNGELKYSDRLDSTNGSMFGNDTLYDEVAYDRNEKSYYFCHILPAGEYGLFTIRYWNFAGGGSGYYLTEDDQFDVPFMLEPGKISTVGNLKLTTDAGKNLIGMPLPIPGGLEMSRLKDNEIQLALQKCPEAARELETIPQKLWEAEYESPFVKTTGQPL